jgi:LCP family protein required for cell wall assembly
MKAPIRDATPTRRRIGVSEKEKTDDQIGVVNTGGEKKIKEADNAKAVKDFLSENYNDDPTDLVDAPRKKKKEKKKKRGHKGLKRFLIVFVILLIVAGGGIFLYLNDFVSQITDGGGLLGLLLSDPDTPLEKDENGRSNILIFGTEGWSMDHPEQYDGGDLTDSMMLISINQDTGDAKAISLPRDLKTTTCTSSGKLNEVYYCNYSEIYTKIAAGQKVSNEERQEYERKAATELAKKFEEILGIKVHYRVHVNWQAVVQVIDAIGGVDVVFVYGDQKWNGNETAIEVSDERGIADMRYDYSGYNFEYQTGKAYHLGGQEALAVARARNAFGGYGASGGNFSREYFQQRIIEAMVKKARASQITSDLVKALKIKEAVGKNFRTNFKDTEIKTLLKLADSDILTRMETISLYNADEGGQGFLTMGMINGISYVYPAEGVGQYSQIHSYIKKQLSGADYINEGAKIVVLNGTKANGVAGNEKNDLEDDGYTVSQVDNAPDKDGLSNFDGVKLYQVNTKMEKTAKALKKRYGVDIITKIPNELKSYDSDFIVIIGNGHKN